jgi:putative Holliday junction resolvase
MHEPRLPVDECANKFRGRDKPARARFDDAHGNLTIMESTEPDQAPEATHGTTTEDADDFARQLPTPGRLIGLDLGTKTIGLALSDVTRMIASPLETIARKKFTIDVKALKTHIATHEIRGLVLGLPRNLDGSEGPRAQSSRAFARNLNKLIALPILLWDERLTTAAVERLLIEADSSRRRRSQVVDKMAANLILQGALDRMRLQSDQNPA